MPGVRGVGPTPFLLSHECAFSKKLNHSNSMPHMGFTPILAARFKTFFKV